MNIYEQQAENKRNTAMLIGVFILLFLAIGIGFDFFMLGWKTPQTALSQVYDPAAAAYRVKPVKQVFYPWGTIAFLIIGCGMAFYGYGNGKKMVLRAANAHLATGLDPKEEVYLNVVSEIAIAAGLPRPAAYIIPDPDPNAFATGTDPEDAAIAVTQGLLNVMTREELAGVVAHEMSHIRNYDIRLMTVVTALAGSVNLVSDSVKGIFSPARSSYGYGSYNRRYRNGNMASSLVASSLKNTLGSSRGGSKKGGGGILIIVLFVLWIVLIIFAPVLTSMLKMAISRQREYLADASAAELTRNPKGLIAALEKIYAATGPTTSLGESIAHLCIMDPRGSSIEERSGHVSDLMATHPPMQKRILKLKAMAYVIK